MIEIKDGGPAFPLADSGFDTIGTNHDHVNGLTVRDYFAAKAMDGVLHMVATGMHELGGDVRPNGADGIAASAYELADAMLRARSQS